MGKTTLQQHRPTPQDNYLPFLPRPQYLYRICICSRRHFLSPCHSRPSTALLRATSSPRPRCSCPSRSSRCRPGAHAPKRVVRRRLVVGAGGLVRWRGSAGSWCVDSRSRGNSVCPSRREGHLRRGSEWVHHPTVVFVSLSHEHFIRLPCGQRTRSIQNPPLRSIIWKKSSYSFDRNQSNRAISKLLQKWHML